MKKLLLLLGVLFIVSCGGNNSSNIMKGAATLPFGVEHTEAQNFLKKHGYKQTKLSQDEIVALLSDVDSLQVWLKDAPHRTSAQSFTVNLGKTTHPAITLFDQNELFALFIPFSSLSREEFDKLVLLATNHLGESEAQDSESFLSHYWTIDSDKSFQIVYKIEEEQFLLLAIDQGIRAKNDLAFFDSIPATNEWFLKGFLGSTYENIVDSETHFYSASADNRSLLYVTKFDTTPILYGYFFNEDNIVETIVFQNIENQEDILAEIFNQKFNMQAKPTREEMEGGLTMTSYVWNLGENTGATIVTYEQSFGEHSASQSYAIISDNFEELKAGF
ncbi:hypothetical protein PVA44_06040 [Entomospira nematocerorum]|uniref:Lipoprotein n=1 Tax=Entomospira nematocerorum TaxID=2719987 RepID=A0A968GDR6_9SPIO|nr:hypothetical protein [Entomospira nematocera]NIZ46420.1 hypothetical protein [Entomospira nematocera]WDI33777.1 hypothetical protein PVA44_06040 [Entomospira nematocera]